MTWARIEPGIFQIQVYTNIATPTFLRATSAEGIDLGSQAVSDNPNDRLSISWLHTETKKQLSAPQIDDILMTCRIRLLFLSMFNLAAKEINLRQFKVLDFVLRKYLHDYTSIYLG
jgi:hypothetical protein